MYVWHDLPTHGKQTLCTYQCHAPPYPSGARGGGNRPGHWWGFWSKGGAPGWGQMYMGKRSSPHMRKTLSCLLMVKRWLMILWTWCILVQKILVLFMIMSNQAMTYEILKEAIRQEFEDILEPEQTFFCRRGLTWRRWGCLLIFVLVPLFWTPWGICTEINAPI